MYSSVNITIYTVGNRTLICIGTKSRVVTTARDGVYFSRDNTGGVGLPVAIAAADVDVFHMEHHTQNRTEFEYIIAELCGTAHLNRMANSGIRRRRYTVHFNNGAVTVNEEKNGVIKWQTAKNR